MGDQLMRLIFDDSVTPDVSQHPRGILKSHSPFASTVVAVNLYMLSVRNVVWFPLTFSLHQSL